MTRRTTIRPVLVFGIVLALGGSALLANGLWHLVRHDDFLGRSLGGALAVVLGLIFALDAYSSPETGRAKRTRVRFSKRMKSGHLLVVILVLGFPLMGQQRGQEGRAAEPRLVHGAGSDAKPVAQVTARRTKLALKYDITRVGDRGVGHGVNLYSAEKELRLGRKLANAVDSSSRFVTDAVITDFVSRLASNLVRNSDATVPFTVKVIESDEPAVFALPGGFLYVTTGLIATVDSEAELAGLMAHEVAHVAARHEAKQASKRAFWRIASAPLIFAGPAGFLVRQVAGVAMPMKFSRDAEREADLLGLQYVYLTGYDPGEFVQFFERLGSDRKSSHSVLARAFSEYPSLEERIAAAREVIEATLPERGEHIVTTSDFDEVQAHILNVRGPQSGRPVLRRRTR